MWCDIFIITRSGGSGCGYRQCPWLEACKRPTFSRPPACQGAKKIRTPEMPLEDESLAVTHSFPKLKGTACASLPLGT